jgi:hypothetical protein
LNLDFVSRLVKSQGVRRLERVPRNTRSTSSSLSPDTGHRKALSSTAHCERFVGHCPMGDLLGDVLSVEQP